MLMDTIYYCMYACSRKVSLQTNFTSYCFAHIHLSCETSELLSCLQLISGPDIFAMTHNKSKWKPVLVSSFLKLISFQQCIRGNNRILEFLGWFSRAGPSVCPHPPHSHTRPSLREIVYISEGIPLVWEGTCRCWSTALSLPHTQSAFRPTHLHASLPLDVTHTHTHTFFHDLIWLS